MSEELTSAAGAQVVDSTITEKDNTQKQQATRWKRFLPSRKTADETSSVNSIEEYKDNAPIEKWSLGILNDKRTEEVPGKWTLC